MGSVFGRVLNFVMASLLAMLTGLAFVAADTAQEQARSTNKAQSNALLQAICKNNLHDVEYFLFEERVDPNLTHYHFSDDCDSWWSRNHDKGQAGNYLWEAARRGHIQIAQALIRAGAHIDVTSRFYIAASHKSLEEYSPLYAAVFHGRLDMVKLLLKHGARQVLPQEAKAPPLILVAAKTGAYRVLKFLLREGADPHTEVVDWKFADHYMYRGDTPLSLVIRNRWFLFDRFDSVQALKALLPHLTDDQTDAQGLGSLLANTYDPRVIEFLIQQGADVSYRDESGNMPLHKHLDEYKIDQPFSIADTHDQDTFYDIIMFLSHPDPLHPASKKLVGDVEILAQSDEVVNSTTGLHTALQLAVRNSDIPSSIIQLLLDRGADVNATTKDVNETPLLMYLQEAWPEPDIKVLKMFLKHGADVNASSDGQTPLRTAAANGYLEALHLLLKNGAADLYDVRERKSMAEKAALEAGQKLAAQTIAAYRLPDNERRAQLKVIRQQAKLNKQLWQALDKDYFTAAIAAIEQGADVNSVWHNDTPLEAVLRFMDPRILRFANDDSLYYNSDNITASEAIRKLISLGAKVDNFQNGRDMQALHMAVVIQSVSLIKLFIETGADPSAPTLYDCTPLDLAKLILNKRIERERPVETAQKVLDYLSAIGDGGNSKCDDIQSARL